MMVTWIFEHLHSTLMKNPSKPVTRIQKLGVDEQQLVGRMVVGLKVAVQHSNTYCPTYNPSVSAANRVGEHALVRTKQETGAKVDACERAQAGRNG
jgi:hypothetical protein